jgi:HD-GYP domain-containing protein (c-di-GMP phosphodiesterase class II)
MPIIRYHHERQDGNGYPDGLHADTLSKSIRTIIVADAYDAMASDRAYRSALTDEQIESELKANSGKQFDPEIAAIVLELHHKGELRQVVSENPGSSSNVEM